MGILLTAVLRDAWPPATAGEGGFEGILIYQAKERQWLAFFLPRKEPSVGC